MLFWCPAFGPLEECWHDTGPCDTGHQKKSNKTAQPKQIISILHLIFHCLTVV